MWRDIEVRYVAFIENRLMADGTLGEVAGRAHGTWVEILESEKDNIGLIAHELEHCRQWWAIPYLHKTLRSLSVRYRTWAEASAYAKQLLSYGRDDQYYEARLAAYAYLMANGYTFRMSVDEARRRILEKC